MTLFEWRYERGWIWIAEREGGELAVWIDPTDLAGQYERLTDKEKHGTHSGDCLNLMSNTEAGANSDEYERVMYVWKSLGSPRIDRTAPGYTAPVFPIDDLEAWAREEDAAFERAASAAEVGADVDHN
jgi:hypothetical protein